MSGVLLIRPFQEGDEEEIVALWERCGLVVPWNDPRRDIERKRGVDPELFLVGEAAGRIAATCMAGYEGHRGWINYLAVDPPLRRRGYGARLMAEAERLLGMRGCPKINLQVRANNRDTVAFYEAIGYRVEELVDMGKRLVDDESPSARGGEEG